MEINGVEACSGFSLLSFSLAEKYSKIIEGDYSLGFDESAEVMTIMTLTGKVSPGAAK